MIDDHEKKERMRMFQFGGGGDGGSGGAHILRLERELRTK